MKMIFQLLLIKKLNVTIRITFFSIITKVVDFMPAVFAHHLVDHQN